MEKIPWKPEYNGYEAFIKKVEKNENIIANVGISEKKPEDNTIAQPKFLKPKPDIWEERAIWIFVGIFIVIGIIFLSKGSSSEIQDQDYCDGSRNAYCP